MKKAHKLRLCEHISSITNEFAETLKPPKAASKRAEELNAVIKDKFGCYEQAVYALVQVLTGEDFDIFKKSILARPPKFSAFRIVGSPSNIHWKEGEVLFVRSRGDYVQNIVSGMDGEGITRHGIMDYSNGEIVPATLEEIKQALTDAGAEVIAKTLNIIFM